MCVCGYVCKVNRPAERLQLAEKNSFYRRKKEKCSAVLVVDEKAM